MTVTYIEQICVGIQCQEQNGIMCKTIAKTNKALLRLNEGSGNS